MQKKSEVQSLENYLSQIAHELRALPSQARADEMREIEAHLRTMIEERGDVAGVLAQFGKPRKVGRDLRKAWESRQQESWWRIIVAIPTGASFYMIGMSSWINISQLFVNGGGFTKSPSIYFLAFATFTVLLSGAVFGSISPKRSRIAGALLSSTILWCWFVVFRSSHQLDFSIFAYGAAFWLYQTFLLLTGIHFGARRGKRLSVRLAK